MKAILLVDIPDDYDEYGSGDWYVAGDNLRIGYKEKDGWFVGKIEVENGIAQLKPMPQKRELEESGNSLIDDCKEYYTNGWNDCLDEMTYQPQPVTSDDFPENPFEGQYFEIRDRLFRYLDDTWVQLK